MLGKQTENMTNFSSINNGRSVLFVFQKEGVGGEGGINFRMDTAQRIHG